MGVDAGDIDNDGDDDLFVTNLTGEGNDLYVNDGSGLFEEQSARSGLGPASRGGLRCQPLDLAPYDYHPPGQGTTLWKISLV